MPGKHDESYESYGTGDLHSIYDFHDAKDRGGNMITNGTGQ